MSMRVEQIRWCERNLCEISFRPDPAISNGSLIQGHLRFITGVLSKRPFPFLL
jgi:hypothetical protein